MLRNFPLILIVFILSQCTPAEKQVSVSPTASIEPYFDLNFTQAERDSLLAELEQSKAHYEHIHAYRLENATPPALQFNPVPVGFEWPVEDGEKVSFQVTKNLEVPADMEELAFFTVADLSELIRTRKITSTALTKMYLSRLKKFGDTLQCVITLTEEVALAQAARADDEIAQGKYRGPLHGIPYGIKDLLAVENTKTTWGAGPFKDQEIDMTSTVVKKLEDAGAVMLVKLTLGALAMGDVWYGGVTKNPWDLTQGSSGSSAGSASATSAGLVAFSIGTETLGSIVSPSTRCGTSGLRPSYGRVSRTGAMALSWSMDKIGPICRSIQDCAIVFDAIIGTDDIDQTLVNTPYSFDGNRDITQLRVGYFKDLFGEENRNATFDNATLEKLKEMGVKLEEVSLPDNMPVEPLIVILLAEAAASFDEITRNNRDSLLVRQDINAWPNSFRSARFIPAVEYINANRIRYQLVQELYKALKDYDVIVTPSFGGTQLLTTNLTGYPCAVVPNGFNEAGRPVSISFISNLYDEGSALELAHAYQKATDFEDKHPEMFKK